MNHELSTSGMTDIYLLCYYNARRYIYRLCDKRAELRDYTYETKLGYKIIQIHEINMGTPEPFYLRR